MYHLYAIVGILAVGALAYVALGLWGALGSVVTELRSIHGTVAERLEVPELGDIQSELARLRRDFNDLDSQTEARYRRLNTRLRREKAEPDSPEPDGEEELQILPQLPPGTYVNRAAPQAAHPGAQRRLRPIGD